ncbi:MAG: DnaJ domain-containing protein [Deltaproteobacteria bacterium]|nr:DnaJ domain-containing protein [Deltaproteobacteria bacterium]MBW2338941.1 DnaJ domain-containing protein [Deltaproteobacteria bacterium]
MKYLIYLILILYVISPYDILPDFFPGLGWIDDLIILGVLYWYHFIYRRAKMRPRYEEAYHQEGKGTKREYYQEEQQQKAQTDPRFSKRDPYQILGVEKGAPLNEVKAAYRKLALKYHPDKVNHLGDEFKILAEKKFKEIQEAYQELVHK